MNLKIAMLLVILIVNFINFLWNVTLLSSEECWRVVPGRQLFPLFKTI